MLIPVGFAEVTWGWRQAAGYRESLTSYGFGISGWDEEIVQVAGAFNTFIDAAGQPSSFTVSRAVVKVGTSDPSAPITFEYLSTDTGGGAGALLPPSTSVLASKRTLLGGRKGKGRNFLPAPLEGQVDNTGTLDGTFRGNYEDAWVACVEDVATQLGDTSAPLGYLLHTDSTPPTEITAVTVAGVVATQRRRLVRGGA